MMHPAQSRRLRHEAAEAAREDVPVFRNGKQVGIVRPRVLGPLWSAEVLPDGPLLGGIFANVLDAEQAIVRHEKAMGR